MLNRIICFFNGHSKGRKIGSNSEYTSYVCKRCGVNYSVKA